VKQAQTLSDRLRGGLWMLRHKKSRELKKMNGDVNVPNWSELFGSLDNRDADSGRSVTSPAAYLADLLQLLTDHFDASDFRRRRPDILQGIPLNGEQAFTLTRQLDIVNPVLGERITARSRSHDQVNATAAGKSVDDILVNASFPIGLPFEFQHERIRQVLKLLRVSHRELHAGFTPSNDIDIVARERLGLSPARAEVILRNLAADTAGLRAAYGLGDTETFPDLPTVEWLRRATSLDRPGIRQLLFSRLSQTAIGRGGIAEQAGACRLLFINYKLPGFVTLNDTESALDWSAEPKQIPPAWFDRVYRLLCLSRWTGIDVASLDLVLRLLCDNTIDVNALHRLAVLVDLRDRTGQDIELLTCLFAELDADAALGAGDDPARPASLFDRVFNGAPAKLAQRFLPSGAAYQPQTYSGWQTLTSTGDLLSDDGENKALRARIQTSLGLSARDLSAVVTRFRDRAAKRQRTGLFAPGVGPDSRVLSCLHRVARLASVTGLSPLDLLQLVDVLENDPDLRRLNAFDVLHHESQPALDLFAVLEAGTTSARSWLIQNLVAIGAWATQANMAPDDLQAIAVVPDPATQPQNPEPMATAQQLLDAFLPVCLTEDPLVAAPISPRSARLALAAIQDPARNLVSSFDTRIVTFDADAVRDAAYAMIGVLDIITVEDLQTLGLGDTLAPYLRSLLIRRGVLDAKGVLIDGGLPARVEDLVLESDESDRFGTIFDLLHEMFTAAADALAPDTTQQDDSESAGTEDSGDQADSDPEQDVELHLFPSDLQTLGLAESEAGEWIDRLVYLGILDASGMVLYPSVFADLDNRDRLLVSSGINLYRADIYSWLVARRDHFLSTKLTLPEEVWDGLKLSDAERDALEHNLVFNGYIDPARQVVEKIALASLTANTFNLAPAFWRQSRAILAALQAALAAHRANLLGLSADSLRPLADRFAARNAHASLSVDFLDEHGRPTAALLAVIDAEQPPLDVVPEFPATQQAQIWSLLRQIHDEAGAFRLTDAALASAGLDGDHAVEVIIGLCASDSLSPDRTLTPEQVARFAAVDSALDFTLPGYVDYARDIFFLLHDVAMATDAAVNALVSGLSAVADSQDNAVLEALASAVGLSPEATSAIIRPLLDDEAHVTPALIGPVLQAAGSDGKVQGPLGRPFTPVIRRLHAFAVLAQKLGLSPRAIEAVFNDLLLNGKFPEAIQLPEGAGGIDALWTGPDSLLYLFHGAQYWTFDPATLTVTGAAKPLVTLSPDFKDFKAVDAVYTLPNGEHWLLAHGQSFRRTAGDMRWAPVPRVWGRVRSRFDDPTRIDATLYDPGDGLLLFAGDQYIRYASWPNPNVDEGYPRTIAGDLWADIGFADLPAVWNDGIDAAIRRKDEVTWLFKDDRYVASDAPNVEYRIIDGWGRVRNNLAAADQVDAVLDVDGRCAVVSGDQVSIFSNSLETDGLVADEGYPRTLASVFPGLPDAFTRGFDAGLADADGLHVFRDQTVATLQDGKWASHPIRERWGLVRNILRETGRVDAAFAGLDGKIYVFSGEQYVRYSGADWNRIDESYPRTISGAWGGLSSVAAAFVLDGATYLFGGGEHAGQYVRYSTRDYTKPDLGYPKPVDDNWWNLPIALIERGFHRPDAVVVAPDGGIHLFSDDETIGFDHNHRWWSEPVGIRQAWPDLPFKRISAGFTAPDGRLYLFSNDPEPAFARYSGSRLQRPDDHYPRPVKGNWGGLVDTIALTGRVDAAVTLISSVPTTETGGEPVSRTYRYLFSGDQFYRYSTDAQHFVDEGYPRRIRDNLQLEPHFANLKAPADRGVDGVWADNGNVYVFLADQIYVGSTTHVRPLDGLGVEAPRAADIEDGRLTIRGKDGWRHISLPEARIRFAEPGMPRILRDAPAMFQEKTSAILRGLDGTSYLFSEQQCYDVALERQYPIGAAWGRVRNRIADDERVDCALMGRDGKLYLFRDDEFVSYTVTGGAVAELADGLPAPVAPHWGGLGSVRHAFVHDDVTYVLESPGEDGTFRYVRYSGTTYDRPNDPYPLTADLSFWGIPSDFVEIGFDRVDAVFADKKHLFLIRGAEYIHFDGEEDVCHAPRPLALRWPGLPHHSPDFVAIRAAAAVDGGGTYFFADGFWLSHDGNGASPLAPIRARWTLLRNRIVQANRVDATFVDGEQTFMFSGDEYVRYSGRLYETVDPGYPRPIAGFLRQETPFALLPAALESAFTQLKPDDAWVETVFRCGGVLFIRIAGQSFALSAMLDGVVPLAQISGIRNELVAREHVDAAFAQPDGKLYLFSGDQYVRYSKDSLDAVDDGYPRTIGGGLLHDLALSPNPPVLPAAFQYDLDAAFLDSGGTLVLFKGRQYLSCEPSGEIIVRPVKDNWGHVSNAFLPSAEEPRPQIDAAFVAADRSLHVFKGGQFLRYADPASEFADEGYPRAIRGRWGDLPPTFEAGIDAAFMFDGRSYFFHDDHYVRYSDPQYRHIDPVGPRPIATGWSARNDFSLRDLRIIQRYAALDQSHPSDDASLTDLLLASPRDNIDPYGMLAGLFDWDEGDVQWLKRRDGFLDRPNRDIVPQKRLDIELVLRIYDTLEMARRVGSNPRDLHDLVWSGLYGATANSVQAADTLYRLLGGLYPGDNWATIERQLGDALSGLCRDAQVAWLLGHDDPPLQDARALSDTLLTDVEVDPSLDSSPIVEAIAAIQLYFYRYLTHQEPAAALKGDDTAARAIFREEWGWLKNYRVWEANRKVFLYPESYIRPELRASRTASFKSLLDDLGQGEITDDSVTQAYKKYLDDYTEVSRLTIAGGYVRPDPMDDTGTELTLFGVTRTDPRRYYFRTATFANDSPTTGLWQAWQALGIDINADRVYPVRAFGRTFVFWAEIEQIQPDPGTSQSVSLTTTGDNSKGSTTVEGQPPVLYHLKQMYSFHDLNGQWTPPQTLGYGAPLPMLIVNPSLRVTATTDRDGVESIVVNYSFGPGLFVGARRLTADLTAVEAEIDQRSDRHIDVLRNILQPIDFMALGPNDVVALGSTSHYDRAVWYSVDLKGGSFLVRPVLPDTDPERYGQLQGNSDGLPDWPSIDAALNGADGTDYFFNNKLMVYWSRDAAGHTQQERIADRWGLVDTGGDAKRRVDAAWTRRASPQAGGNPVLFLARGDRYGKYTNEADWADEVGDQAIADAQARLDGVPNWTRIDAAFTDETTNTTWFFHGQTFVALDAAGRLGVEARISQHWGQDRNDFSAPAAGVPTVVAAFLGNARGFLIGQNSYITYNDPAFLLSETPKAPLARSVLQDLGCTNSDAADAAAVIYWAVDTGDELLFKTRLGDSEEGYSLKNKLVTKVAQLPPGGPWSWAASFVHQGKTFVLANGPSGASLTVAGGAEQRSNLPAGRINAMVVGSDGNLYLFGTDRYVMLPPAEITVEAIGAVIDQWVTRSLPIGDRWGRTRNAFTDDKQGVTGAVVHRGHTFLVSGAWYIRYSNSMYRFVDPGYPALLAGNQDGLPQETFQGGFFDTARGLSCFFAGADHVYDGSLSSHIPNPIHWGLPQTNILRHGVDAAYRVGDRHYLISGNEIAVYTAGAGHVLPTYMDGPPARVSFNSFTAVVAAFTYGGHLYLAGTDRFVRCAVDQPNRPLRGYPRFGQAPELVDDVRQTIGLPGPEDATTDLNAIGFDLTGRKVQSLTMRNNSLLIDVGDLIPGQYVIELDLTTGLLSRDLSTLPFLAFAMPGLQLAMLRAGSTVQRAASPVTVDLPAGRYTFSGSLVTITPPHGQPATFRIADFWGTQRPFDAAINQDGRLFLFIGARYASISEAEATAGVGSTAWVQTIEQALVGSRPIHDGLVGYPLDALPSIDAVFGDSTGFWFFRGAEYWQVAKFPTEVEALPYVLVRLTTSTAAALNRVFFSGGVTELLKRQTQSIDETPGFTTGSGSLADIHVKGDRVRDETLPVRGHLDFASANGIYLWEIFFHAPFLIAGMLSSAQRFEEAKVWYEHIFDPAEPADAWKFLPFLELDVERILKEIDDRLIRLSDAGVDTSAVQVMYTPYHEPLFLMDSAFKGARNLDPAELKLLSELRSVNPVLPTTDIRNQAIYDDLGELFGMIRELYARWEGLQTARQQLQVYLQDPFDPHAIAALRPVAYRKAIVMRYLDNLLAWGDMLFGQYTRETITEARMLYIEASYLLGRQPESAGPLLLAADQPFGQLRHAADEFLRPVSTREDGAIDSAPGGDASIIFAASLLPANNTSLTQPYFFISPNDELERYWVTVADRLWKIRHGLNLAGEKQPLALFEPPINPMALVSAAAGGMSLADAIASVSAVDVPHYRFTFLVAKAQDLAQKLTQLGSELLGAMEKRDAEALNRLQTTQEGIILTLTRDMQKAQLEEARTNLTSLQQASENAHKRMQVYSDMVNTDYLPTEGTQIDLLKAAFGINVAAAAFTLTGGILEAVPKGHIGLFTFGLDTPDFGKLMAGIGQGLQTTAGAIQGFGEILGITAQHERSMADWRLQRDLATIDAAQLDAQIEGANWQIEGARQQIAITERQIAQNDAVARYFRSKFSNQELYEWMASQLSGLHYQTYQLALSTARAAERAFQFERGSGPSQTSFIQGQYWDNQRKGLLSGYLLGLDLDRMETAFIATDARRFEITKSIALIKIDPMAFLKLKADGVCEFDLTEGLFDYDFPGHYRRQVKTIAVDLDLGDGVLANAMLTQLTNRLVMEPDPKAVAFLLAPQDTPPPTIRTNWKSQQQIALSSHAQGDVNSGMFELRFDSDQFLPFEGTGVVSRWRLELCGPPGAYDLRNLAGVTITLKYTALQGGDAFRASVRGLLKPSDSVRCFSLSTDFADVWQAFIGGDDPGLDLPLHPSDFPGMASGGIRAIYTRYETDAPGAAAFTINLGAAVPLADGKSVDTSGLTVRAAGTTLRLTLRGDRTALMDVYLVMAYKGGVQ
jgi:hypothetical protein